MEIALVKVLIFSAGVSAQLSERKEKGTGKSYPPAPPPTSLQLSGISFSLLLSNHGSCLLHRATQESETACSASLKVHLPERLQIRVTMTTSGRGQGQGLKADDLIFPLFAFD